MGEAGARLQMPRAVVALGFVSMFMDMSSEMVHSVLPLFMVTTLGVGALTVGLIEGIAESTAAIVKVFSGALSDRIGRRKPLLLLGYGLSTLTKPLFPLADSVGAVLFARFADRIGKGIRVAPRDALLADVTPEAIRGSAYGLRQSMDTVGAFVGPALAMALMVWTANDFRFVFWVAVIPAVAVVGILAVFVDEPAKQAQSTPRSALRWSELRLLPRPFWIIALLGAVLTLARFSDAFLLLRADSVGLGLAYAPAILMVMNVVYALSAWPAGWLSDRIGKSGLLAAGIGVLIAADVVLALAVGPVVVFLGAGLWGLHMGMTQGILTALVADRAPPQLRGTAFGLFNLAGGVALLFASALAGGLWKLWGPEATFAGGAFFSTVALVGCWRARKQLAPLSK